MMAWTSLALGALLLAPTARGEKFANTLRLEEERGDGMGDLARYLADPDLSLRRRAVLSLGRIGDRAYTTALCDVLNDGNVELRRMAAFSLGLLGDRSAVPRLIMALNDPDPAVRGGVADALARLGERSHAAAIADMVIGALPQGARKVTVRGDDPGNPNDPWIELRLGMFALARLGDAAAAERVLLSEGQPRFDWWAATFLASRIASPALKPVLLAGARSSDPLARLYAAQGLGALADPATLDGIEALIVDRDLTVVAHGLRALSHVQHVKSVSLAERALDASDPGVVQEALSALAHQSIPAGMHQRIVGFVGHSDAGVRAAALQAVAHADRELLALVLSGLDPDPQCSVRATLAETLGDIGDDAALAILHGMIADPDQRVLPVVLDAIARARPREARPALKRQIEHNDAVVRTTVLSWLAKIGDKQDSGVVLAAYDRALGDVEPDARLAALTAIAARCGTSGESTLLAAMRHDPLRVVRAHARRLLLEKGQAVENQKAASEIRPYLDYRLAMAPFAQLSGQTLYTPRAIIHTRLGTIEVHLNIVEAPIACAAFIRLARRGYYNDLIFDDVVPGEIVFGGCARGDGRGNAGLALPTQAGQRPFGRGAVGIAESEPDTGSGRFFITLTPRPDYDGQKTLLGWVVDGIETAARLRPGDAIEWIEIWDGE